MSIINSAQLNSSILNPQGGKVNITTLSNTQRTNNVDTDIIVEKQVEKNWALPKDEILVTTKITNNADVNLEDFHFQDTLSQGASLVEGWVKIGIEERTDLNPITGFDLSATIGAFGGECEISYKILVDEYPEVSTITLSSTIGVTLDSKQFELTSNTARIQLLDNEIFLLKSANTTAVKSGDELTYTIQITNNGNIENTELFFTDSIPTGTTFVAGSVKVNNVSMADANPENGFSLNSLPPQGEIIVEFKVSVN